MRQRHLGSNGQRGGGLHGERRRFDLRRAPRPRPAWTPTRLRLHGRFHFRHRSWARRRGVAGASAFGSAARSAAFGLASPATLVRGARSVCLTGLFDLSVLAGFSCSAGGRLFFEPRLSVGLSDFSCGGCFLPWLKCCRYCLPNFPHSPAGEGRERQRLHAFLADGAQARALTQIDSTCRSLWRSPGTACRDPRATASGPDPCPSIRGGHPESGRISFRVSLFCKYCSISFFHSSAKLLRHPGVSISGKIDEIERPVDPIKIDRLCATRGVAGKCQPFLPGESVDQAGFPYVTSS